MTTARRANPWKERRRASVLEIDWLILQGPHGGLSSDSLAVEGANQGCFWSYSAFESESDAGHRNLTGDSRRTSGPFSINLRNSIVDKAKRAMQEHFQRSVDLMHGYFRV